MAITRANTRQLEQTQSNAQPDSTSQKRHIDAGSVHVDQAPKQKRKRLTAMTKSETKAADTKTKEDAEQAEIVSELQQDADASANMGLFSCLPRELRNKIYTFILKCGNKAGLPFHAPCKVTFTYHVADRKHNRKVTHTKIEVSNHPLALLATCRQIRKEASLVFKWKLNSLPLIRQLATKWSSYLILNIDSERAVIQSDMPCLITGTIDLPQAPLNYEALGWKYTHHAKVEVEYTYAIQTILGSRMREYMGFMFGQGNIQRG